jgi:glyoxylase-like metal-dependent hydrolase (beta-lactamase superfamily II)
MSTISRRTFLAGSTSSAALLTAAPCFIDAFISAARAQSAGFNRYKVGAIEVTAVADGSVTFGLPETFVVNAKKDQVAAVLKAAGAAEDKVTIPFTPLVVRSGNTLAVIDTGMGAAAGAQPNATAGQFQKNLSAAGIDAGKVTHVVISHFHADHINGLLTADNKPQYPNAQMKKAPAGRVADGFKNARRVFDALNRKVTQYQWGRQVVPGLTAVGTPGHTPGHTSFTLASGRDSVFIQSDITNIPALFVANPGWHVMFDQDAKQAEATRRKTFDMLAAQKTRVQGFHFPFPALGRIEKTGTGYRLVAA